MGSDGGGAQATGETDLEGRSRRNNLRIYGVPGDTEKGFDLVGKYVEYLRSTELGLGEMELHVQRCHRALTRMPGPEATPRSIVVNFLKFETKELILKKVWGKKRKTVKVGGKQIFFDHDYMTEIVQK